MRKSPSRRKTARCAPALSQVGWAGQEGWLAGAGRGVAQGGGEAGATVRVRVRE
jgi:hypothetical protein